MHKNVRKLAIKFDLKTFNENCINKLIGIKFIATYFDVSPEISCDVKKVFFHLYTGNEKSTAGSKEVTHTT